MEASQSFALEFDLTDKFCEGKKAQNKMEFVHVHRIGLQFSCKSILMKQQIFPGYPESILLLKNKI
jgi:hypothetical protein